MNAVKKTVVIFYLAALVSYYSWLIYKGFSSAHLNMIAFGLQWMVNIAGLLAIFNAFIKDFNVDVRIWRIIFSVTLAIQGYQLYKYGLFSLDMTMVQNSFVLLQYLLLVGPSLAALYLLSTKE